MKISAYNITTSAFLCVLLLLPTSVNLSAQSADEIESQIEDRSERIEELNREIDKYESELQSTRSEQNTLKQTVSNLDSSVRRLSNQVNETRQSIASTESEIRKLEISIRKTARSIDGNRQAVARMLALLEQSSHNTFVETLLSADSLADAWGRVSQLQQIQSAVHRRLEALKESRRQLQTQKQEAQEHRSELAGLREEYADRQAIIIDQKEEKAELLAATNQEAQEYQNLLAEKRAQKEKFEAELRSFEEQLNSSASNTSVPSGVGQFAWPVSPVRITQQFGGTEFAKRNPGAYGRPFHNGTDFGVPVGTDVLTVADGTVRATGNTDRINGCYSYGKWVLVDHGNNLSTLYAHLSRISVSSGDQLSQGDRIGYAGNTGYSTGPHLHLTTYVQPDVRIVALGEVKERTNCANAQIPVAPLDSYLNSMEYLPSL